jgi:hypothetical protein
VPQGRYQTPPQSAVARRGLIVWLVRGNGLTGLGDLGVEWELLRIDELHYRALGRGGRAERLQAGTGPSGEPVESPHQAIAADQTTNGDP